MAIRAMDWQRHIETKVQIYRNLNNGRISVQVCIGGRWLAVGHVTDLVLQAVQFTAEKADASG